MLDIAIGPFVVQSAHLLMLACVLLAGAVGHVVGRKSGTRNIGIFGALADMALAGMLAARLVFVVTWFALYRAAPLGIIDIRDGGFTPWAGLLAGLLVGAWRGWRAAPLRRPLALGVLVGMLAWDMSGGAGLLAPSQQPVMPVLPLQTLAGAPATLAAFGAGKPMVVNLWASWCPPCRREMPLLAAAQRNEPGISFVFVDQGETPAVADLYMRSVAPAPGRVLFDPAAALGHAVGSSALPTTLFYSADGRLHHLHLGELSAASLAAELAGIRSSK
jgi:thiol-disulfide isomerase/thioredoxin